MKLTFRPARAGDLPAIITMLADDPLGATREIASSPLPQSYYDAFQEIAGDPHNELLVAELAGRVVGALQWTIIPGLSYQGSRRMLVEGVRVAADVRGQGIGRALMEQAIAHAGERGCRMVQLTSHQSRADARRFYEGLGFRASHVGMVLYLE
jgi:ribosomal protein S18 acetylase RimI-like enzyme